MTGNDTSTNQKGAERMDGNGKAHDYGIHAVSRPIGTSLAGYSVECSCGFEEMVKWTATVIEGKVYGETERQCRERAAQIALDHVGSSLELSTRSDYRRRQFVLSSDGMDEMFPGAK